MKKLMFCLAASLLFTGCATTKISPETRNKLNEKQTLLKAAPVTIVSDGCLVRNELGTDLIVAEQSALTSQKFADLLSQQLNDQGVQVNNSFRPFVCGYMPQQQLQKYDYKVNSEAKRIKVTQYPLLSTDQSVPMTAQQQQLLLGLNQSFNKWQQSTLQSVQKNTPATTFLELNDTDVAALKELTQSNYIFMVSLTGVDASFGQKFASGALSVGVSLATIGAGANFVSVIMPKEGQHYVVHILDLSKKEVIWTTGGMLKGKIYGTKNHTVEAKAILNPLFEVSTQ